MPWERDLNVINYEHVLSARNKDVIKFDVIRYKTGRISQECLRDETAGKKEYNISCHLSSSVSIVG